MEHYFGFETLPSLNSIGNFFDNSWKRNEKKEDSKLSSLEEFLPTYNFKMSAVHILLLEISSFR